MKKKLIRIFVGSIVLIGLILIGMEQLEIHRKEELKKEKAEHTLLVQKHFADLIDLGYEYQESIEQLSVASVEQMMEVMDIDKFDYEKACEVADIGEDADVIKEKFYINAGTIMRSIESAKECPETCPNVVYDYRGVGLGSTDMFLLYYYSDIPEKAWKYDGAGSNYDGYEKITENLYAIWFEPPYT